MDKSNIWSFLNKFTTWSIFLFCVFCCCCHCLDSLDKQYDSSSEQDQPKQFVINQEKRVLIVRGKGEIYELNDRLENNKNVPSPENGNNDYLMINLPDSKMLLICQHNGKCEIRNSTDLSLIISEPQTVFICQSGQKMKTFVGVASDLKSYSGLSPLFGGSYCRETTYRMISANQKSNLNTLFDYIINLKNTEVARTYPVYFRCVIQYSKFILFFTNQKISIKSTLFTSKIIKICKESDEFKRVTYEDIPITCQRGNKEYRLLQHATLLRVSENDKLAAEMCQNKSDCAVIIGVFSSGNDPDNPDMSSAVCVFAVDTILQFFLESRRMNLVGTSNRFDGGYMDFVGTRFNLSKQDFDNSIKILSDLSDLKFCSFSNNINFMSNSTLQGKALHESGNTMFTKIESLMTNGFAHVYIGTSDGKLLENKLESRVIGNSVTVEYGKAVTEMGQMNRRIYAMTENKLEDLPDEYLKYWLPAAEQKCVSLNLNKIGIPLDTNSVDVTITTYPPINITSFTGVTFKCMYDNLREKPVVANNCNGIVGKQDHGQYWFYLLAVKEGSVVVVAKTLFWTYDCRKFDTRNSNAIFKSPTQTPMKATETLNVIFYAVIPENSTLGGNTEVVIEGTNFGVNSSDVTKLSMAGIDCIEVIKRKNQFQKLWCKTGPSNKEHTGPVTITVNGKHNSYGQFSYKDQVLKAIKPNTIIKEGGVWLTISGTNLNVGNKKYVVFLNSTIDMEGVLCENALLSVDDFITCSVNRYPSKFDRFEHQINLDKLIVMFDGNTTKELAMNFSFVSNPYDIRLSAIKSFSR
ncbi:hypothetical protein KUTeg_021369 [Tegillarca granosa]|uniref:Sema domain-containing protein n=1 Tax=Tegillarca granosa TaxID=220873 RepID=A0ABQ9EFN3_TEGGR|nr:hypothetical protein KUTeg_021369 [Tegillarca granosa]